MCFFRLRHPLALKPDVGRSGNSDNIYKLIDTAVPPPPPELSAIFDDVTLSDFNGHCGAYFHRRCKENMPFGVSCE